MDIDLFYKEFGDELKRRRKMKGKELTQSELAERVGMTRTSITNIEAGRQRVPLHLLYILASAVGAEPDELLPAKERITSKTETEELLAQSLDGDMGEYSQLNHDSQSWVSRVLTSHLGKKPGEKDETEKG